MSYPLGQSVRLSTGTIVDATGTAVDPSTLTLTITLPDATTTTFQKTDATRDSVGVYHYDYLPPQFGLYVWKWLSTAPNAADNGGFEVADEDTEAWLPSTDDVANLLAHRTVDATGVPSGKFSATTVPSAAQVGVLVLDVAGEIAAAAGVIPPVLFDDAKLVAILGTAALVEASFDDGSDLLGQMLATRYQNALARLMTAAAQINSTGEVTPEGAPPAPQYSFPDITCIDLTTTATTW